ncbi:MAG: internal scaffolding protein [Microvirus sp.]|nr:MAG: internal scaffolding protein [Microvirus sp.]
MAKSVDSTYPLTLIGFYQPHEPVDFDGRVVDPFTGEITFPPSRTKLEFAAQCDINNIIKEFTRTGQINHIAAKAAQGAFLDLPDDLDYQTSLNAVNRAQDAFAALPAAIRNRFGGDPAKFLAFCDDPANGPEMLELGLRDPPPRSQGGVGGAPPTPTASADTVAPPSGSKSEPRL